MLRENEPGGIRQVEFTETDFDYVYSFGPELTIDDVANLPANIIKYMKEQFGDGLFWYDNGVTRLRVPKGARPEVVHELFKQLNESGIAQFQLTSEMYGDMRNSYL